MTKIGIDPGISGALAILTDDNQLEDMCDMPTMLVGKKNHINGAQVAKILNAWLDLDKHIGATPSVYIEQVSAMPSQGVSSMFNFGMGYGIIIGVVTALGLPIIHVRPAAWKKRAGLLHKDKQASRTLAQQLYPQADLGLKRDVGKAEAILIARFGA